MPHPLVLAVEVEELARLCTRPASDRQSVRLPVPAA